jgi:hypothetical protein
VQALRISAKLLKIIVLLACPAALLSLQAQQLQSTQDSHRPGAFTEVFAKPIELGLPPATQSSQIPLMSGNTQSYFYSSFRPDALNFEKPIWSSTPGTIERMESAFYCNDTPFIDQVRLPLASLWHGRLKFTGFESDVTTANFVLGLPGQGSLHSLSAFGNGFLATHTPPSDQLAGVQMTFRWHGNSGDPGENRGLHGVQHLVRASHGFLPFVGNRTDAASFTLR